MSDWAKRLLIGEVPWFITKVAEDCASRLPAEYASIAAELMKKQWVEYVFNTAIDPPGASSVLHVLPTGGRMRIDWHRKDCTRHYPKEVVPKKTVYWMCSCEIIQASARASALEPS